MSAFGDWVSMVDFQADVHRSLCQTLADELDDLGADDVTAAMVSDALATIGATIAWRETPPSLMFQIAFCGVDAERALRDIWGDES